jgi:hypothetical protein
MPKGKNKCSSVSLVARRSAQNPGISCDVQWDLVRSKIIRDPSGLTFLEKFF